MGRTTGRFVEVALNQQVKDLIQKLGEAIHESVSESDHISGVVKEIREQGFDVLLMLEATIGLNEVEEEGSEIEAEDGEVIEAGPFTRNDVSFLKSLRITTGEDESQELTNQDLADGSLPGNYGALPDGSDLGNDAPPPAVN
jgi:hypothetical protein